MRRLLLGAVVLLAVLALPIAVLALPHQPKSTTHVGIAATEATTTTTSCPVGTALGDDGLCHGACPIYGTTTCRDTPTTEPPTTTIPEPPPTTAPPAPSPPKPDPVALPDPAPQSSRTDYWFAMGRCEQPGSGEGGVDWTAHDSNYQGGLGFYYGTWDQFKLPGYPDDANLASPAQQITVADRVWDAVVHDMDSAIHAWGCVRVVGYRPG